MSQVYPLMFGSQTIPVYCHMGNFGCGDGGWTLAMKIDGTKVQISLPLLKIVIIEDISVRWKPKFYFKFSENFPLQFSLLERQKWL